MPKNILGSKSSEYKLTPDQKEQGTSLSGYEEKGPYHCEDCIHRIGGLESDLPFCIHPIVLIDPKLKKKRIKYQGQNAVEVNMERGCCKFVKQSLEKDKD